MEAIVQAAFVAGAIAAIVALIGHLISRSNVKLSTDIDRENSRLKTKLTANLKLAEMRQSWINRLRDDMAAFQSFGVTPDLPQAAQQEFYRLGTRIELFMNPKDENYKPLQDSLYNFLYATTIEEKYAANSPYIDVCQKILKREWDVLKKDLRCISD